MILEYLVRKVLGKKDFKLSKEIPISYIVKRGFLYSIGIFRGQIRRFGMEKVGKHLFLGKKVVLFNKRKIKFGSNVRIDDFAHLDALSLEGITLGNRVKIGNYGKVVCSGSLSNLGKGIRIGDDTSFAENCFFGAAGGIEIGRDVIAGQNIRFHSENHNYSCLDIPIRLQGVNRKGIKIGNNVWIGAGVIFLDGSEIGDGCIIAANTVVNGVFSKNSVIGGVPSKLIKQR